MAEDFEFKKDEVVFDYDAEKDSSNPAPKARELDETVIHQYYTSSRKFTDEEIQRMRESYQTVVVNDFSDEYHLSDEERYNNAEEAKIVTAMRKSKRKCNNLADYVRSMRLRVDAIEYIAKTNGVYEPDEFKHLIAKGKIILTGLSFPRYTGKNKKSVNWEFIADFIADRTRDPSELMNTSYSEEMDAMAHDDNGGERLFGASQYKEILDSADSTVEVGIVDYDKKSMKQLVEDSTELLQISTDYRRKLKNKIQASRIYEVSGAEDDFRSITLLDERLIKPAATKPPEFHGNFDDEGAYAKWLMQYENWLENETYVKNDNGQYVHPSYLKQKEINSVFEEEGWNVRLFASSRGYADVDKRLKKKKKRDENRAKSIKKNVLNAIDRHEKRKKKKHKKSKESKLLKKMRDESLSAMKDLTDVGGNYSDFEDYEDAMTEASWNYSKR